MSAVASVTTVVVSGFEHGNPGTCFPRNEESELISSCGISAASADRHSRRVARYVRTKVMQGGQVLRCSSSAFACSPVSVPSMYSPRRSTHSLQCSMGLVKRARPVGSRLAANDSSRPAKKDAARKQRIRCFRSFRGYVEELTQLLAQGQPGAVEPAFHCGDGQIQRLGDVLVGQSVHVLEEEDRPIIVR